LAWAARVGRALTNSGGIFAELGLEGGGADEGFVALDGGLGIRLLPHGLISPSWALEQA
jgi:hypothetical protein